MVIDLGFYIGVDLGGTNITAAVCDENGIIYGIAKGKTLLPRSCDQIVDSILELISNAVALSSLPLSHFNCLGVGTSGIVNRGTGIVDYSCNLGFQDTPLSQRISQRLNKKVYLENDANAAALGEYIAGAGRNTKHFVAVTLGTGIGGGIIIDGKLYSGFNNAAGELGHMVLFQKGEPCSCGRLGCFETYASATALIRQTKEMMQEDPQKTGALWQAVGGDINLVDGKTAFRAEREGDSIARKVVDQYISYLACGLTNIINIFQPEVLCLGGGIAGEGSRVLDPVRKIVQAEEYARASSNHCRIVNAELGTQAGVIGAALLPLYQHIK